MSTFFYNGGGGSRKYLRRHSFGQPIFKTFLVQIFLPNENILFSNWEIKKSQIHFFLLSWCLMDQENLFRSWWRSGQNEIASTIFFSDSNLCVVMYICCSTTCSVYFWHCYVLCTICTSSLKLMPLPPIIAFTLIPLSSHLSRSILQKPTDEGWLLCMYRIVIPHQTDILDHRS